MDPTAFKAPEAGRVIRMPQGYVAFVPAPLPPALEYGADLVRALSRADAALSELSGLGRHLPNPHLLIAPYVRREAVLSSRIEGTKATLSDLLRDEMPVPPVSRRTSDVRQGGHYVVSLEHGVRRSHTPALSLRLVR